MPDIGHAAKPEGLDVEGLIAPVRVHGQDLPVHAREELQDGHLLAEPVLEPEGPAPGRQDMAIDLHPDGADLGDVPAVDAVKGVKAQGPDLGGPAAQDHLPVEGHEDAGAPALGHVDGAAQVLQGVRHRVGDGQLAAGQDHRDLDVPQHKGEHGGGIGQGIRPMDHHDPVIPVPSFADQPGQAGPVLRKDVGGVHRGIVQGGQLGLPRHDMELLQHGVRGQARRQPVLPGHGGQRPPVLMISTFLFTISTTPVVCSQKLL